MEAKGITKVSDFIKENNMFWKATRKVKQDACRVVNRASKENHPHDSDRNRFSANRVRPRTGNGRNDRAKEFANLKGTINDTSLKLSQMTRLEMFEYYFTQLKDKTILPDQM